MAIDDYFVEFDKLEASQAEELRVLDAKYFLESAELDRKYDSALLDLEQRKLNALEDLAGVKKKEQRLGMVKRRPMNPYGRVQGLLTPWRLILLRGSRRLKFKRSLTPWIGPSLLFLSIRDPVGLWLPLLLE